MARIDMDEIRGGSLIWSRGALIQKQADVFLPLGVRQIPRCGIGFGFVAPGTGDVRHDDHEG